MLERVYRGEIAVLKDIKSRQNSQYRRETLSGQISKQNKYKTNNIADPLVNLKRSK